MMGLWAPVLLMSLVVIGALVAAFRLIILYTIDRWRDHQLDRLIDRHYPHPSKARRGGFK